MRLSSWFVQGLVVASFVLAPAQGASAASALDCVHPAQAADADANVKHLLEDLQHLGPASIVANLEPERSPHVSRLTIPGDLVIAHPLLLANVDLRVCGDVWVTPSGSLTMYGATLTVDHPAREGLLRVWGLQSPTDRVADTGKLSLLPLSRVHDDPLLGGAASRLLLTHPDRPSIVEGAARPVRVHIEEGAALEMEGSVVRSTQGIEAEAAAVSIRDSAIESVRQGLYLFNVHDVLVADTTIRAKTTGVYLASSERVTLERVSIAGASKGVQAMTSTELALLGARVQARDMALYAFATAGVEVVGSVLEATNGVYLSSASEALLRGNTITARSTAITLSATPDSVVEENVLRPAAAGGDNGLFVQNAQGNVLRCNDVRGFMDGVHAIYAANTRVEGNTVTGGVRGAYFSTSPGSVALENNLFGNSLVDLQSFRSGTLDATRNWWGQASGPAKGQVLGTVKVEPWLTSPGTCLLPGVDTGSPSVQLLRPVPGAVYVQDQEVRPQHANRSLARAVVVAGPLTVLASAGDADSGVAEVRFAVDGEVVAVDSEAPYGFVWDPPLGSAGSHLLKATAVDHAGNEASAAVLVTLEAGTAS